MDSLYIEIEIQKNNNETEIYTTISSFLALYTYRYLNAPDNVLLKFVNSTLAAHVGKLQLHTEHLKPELTEKPIICKQASTLPAIHDLRLPIYEKNANTYIAGICAVCRELISRQNSATLKKLLGFKASCLQAPAEVSIWTRFCEVDLVQVLNQLLKGNLCEQIPVEIVRFEQHMNEPVRMHNIYKEAREQVNRTINGKKAKRKERIQIESTVPKESLLIEHRFAEGVSFTITDLLLYPLFRLIFDYFANMLQHFPLLSSWLNEIEQFEPQCNNILNDLFYNVDIVNNNRQFTIPNCTATSLYKAHTKRYKPRNRIYTIQSNVDAVLEKLTTVNLKLANDCAKTYDEHIINWDEIEPTHAKSSALPEIRLIRKRQQLENMTNAVVSVAKPGSCIIDFCSGTGHLGLLLALKLPGCTVIVMENKPYSLAQAQKRSAELKLSNCRFYQCNIDYFIGCFDVGTSLHACGTATDIVLQQCRRVHASFVCCPCCYGSIHPMPHIKYPLSKHLCQVLTEKDYLYIAHTADQAHEIGTTNCKPETVIQGKYCMNIIDVDRKLQAEEAGYKVIFTHLKPEQCTPKNHLLVGCYVGAS